MANGAKSIYLKRTIKHGQFNKCKQGAAMSLQSMYFLRTLRWLKIKPYCELDCYSSLAPFPTLLLGELQI